MASRGSKACSATASELAVFENGVRGLALNLDVREIGAAILGEFNEIEEGQQVKRTGEDPVRSGRRRLPGPWSGRWASCWTASLVESRAAPAGRPRRPRWWSASVKELQTGIKAIDAMTAIGRGQRR